MARYHFYAVIKTKGEEREGGKGEKKQRQESATGTTATTWAVIWCCCPHEVMYS